MRECVPWSILLSLSHADKPITAPALSPSTLSLPSTFFAQPSLPFTQLSLCLAPSPFRATSPLRSASPHCGSVIVVHGVLIYRLWVVIIYRVGIYYFIVLFTTLDVGFIVTWVIKINKNVYFLKPCCECSKAPNCNFEAVILTCLHY